MSSRRRAPTAASCSPATCRTQRPAIGSSDRGRRRRRRSSWRAARRNASIPQSSSASSCSVHMSEGSVTHQGHRDLGSRAAPRPLADFTAVEDRPQPRRAAGPHPRSHRCEAADRDPVHLVRARRPRTATSRSPATCRAARRATRSRKPRPALPRTPRPSPTANRRTSSAEASAALAVLPLLKSGAIEYDGARWSLTGAVDTPQDGFAADRALSATGLRDAGWNFVRRAARCRRRRSRCRSSIPMSGAPRRPPTAASRSAASSPPTA